MRSSFWKVYLQITESITHFFKEITFLDGSRISVKLGSALRNPMTSHFACMVFNFIVFHPKQESIIAPKTAFPPEVRFIQISQKDGTTRNATIDCVSYRIQWSQDWTLMTMLMRKFDNQVPPPSMQDSRSPPIITLEGPVSQTNICLGLRSTSMATTRTPVWSPWDPTIGRGNISRVEGNKGGMSSRSSSNTSKEQISRKCQL